MMKKIVVALLFAASFVLLSNVGYAAEKMTLGQNNFAIKVDSIHFDNSNTDNGVYVGAEGYKEIEKNLYLGAEVGYTSTDSRVKIFGAAVNSDTTFLPIEINLKYAVRIIDHLIIDFGIGGSYNYTKEEISGSDSIDEWLFGGQGFGDINVTIGKVFLGINAKIQFTDKGRDTGKNYSNQRIGGQFGFIF
jgi:Outer membrane protein beta-barrel domain